jgi:hypothetical protein
MTVKDKSRYQMGLNLESLEDYVGTRSSNEIMQNLNKMDKKEIAEFKDSLETIFRLISADRVVH